MSIKSTHFVTREFAIAAIKKKLNEIDELSDSELANLLEEVIHNGFYNFIITSEDDLQNHDYVLTDLSYIPPRNDAW